MGGTSFSPVSSQLQTLGRPSPSLSTSFISIPPCPVVQSTARDAGLAPSPAGSKSGHAKGCLAREGRCRSGRGRCCVTAAAPDPGTGVRHSIPRTALADARAYLCQHAVWQEEQLAPTKTAETTHRTTQGTRFGGGFGPPSVDSQRKGPYPAGVDHAEAEPGFASSPLGVPT